MRSLHHGMDCILRLVGWDLRVYRELEGMDCRVGIIGCFLSNTHFFSTCRESMRNGVIVNFQLK